MSNKLDGLISVIIPIYNVEKYLDRCINSVIAQNYKNLEILLINDGSTDSCDTICKKWESKDKRIKYYTKSNGGLSDARNYGLDRMHGSYVMFIDSDDYIDNNCISELYKEIVENNVDVSVTNPILYFENKNIFRKYVNKENFYGFLDKEEAINAVLYSDICLTSAWGKLFKSNLFKSLRFLKGRICEDLDIVYKIFNLTNGIVLLPTEHYFYCQHDNSICNSGFGPNKMDYIYVADNLLDYVSKFIPECFEAAVICYTNVNISMLIRMPKNYFFANEFGQKLINNIKKIRRHYIKNRRAPLRFKIFCFLSYIIPFYYLKLLYDLYVKIKK